MAAALMLVSGLASATPGQVDTSLMLGTDTNADVRAVAVDSQNRLLVAGGFSTFNGAPAGRLVRLLENGSVDPTFNIGTGANSDIKAIEILSDGRILVGGQFTTFGTTTTRGLVLLAPSGAIDPSFTSRFTSVGMSSGVACIEALPGGNLMIGGYFTQYDGVSVGRYATITPTGALLSQTLQNPGADSHVYDIDLQADGSVLLCGFFAGINGHPSGRVARLLPGGAVDTSFSTGTQIGGVAYSVAGQPDGKVIIAGSFGTFFGLGQRYLGRLTSSGSLDASFAANDGPNLNVYGITVDPQGRIVIAGQFSQFHGAPMTGIGRLLPEGSRDPSFSFSPSVSASFIQEYPLDAQGRILAYGWPKFFATGTQSNLLRLMGGAGTPRADWQFQYFGSAAATGDAAWHATPAHDGITNLEKYGLGFQGDPRTAAKLWDDQGLLHGFWNDGVSSGFRYKTDLSRSDVSAVAQWSTTLSDWITEGLQIVEESRVGTLVTWKVTLSGNHPAAFFKMHVSLID